MHSHAAIWITLIFLNTCCVVSLVLSGYLYYRAKPKISVRDYRKASAGATDKTDQKITVRSMYGDHKEDGQ